MRSFIGNGVPILIERVMAARCEATSAARKADLVDRFMRHYEAASADLTTVFPGVIGLLAALQSAGHPIGLCTNKPEAAARAVLVAFGLDRYFAAVIGGDSLPERKPHPEPLRATLRALGGGTAVYIGDSEVDVETALAAGMPLLLFSQGYRKTPLEDLTFAAAFEDFATVPRLMADLGLT